MSTSPFPAAPTAEWRRQSDLTRFYGLFPSPALARDLFNIVEGQRIETLIRLAYPGIRRDMDLIQAQTLERREEMGGDPADLPDVGQVVDALMVSTMGAEPPFDDMSPHVREAAEGVAPAFDTVTGGLAAANQNLHRAA